jgi:hypothetical protein
MDGALLARLRVRWQDIRLDLVTELDRPFGIYEIVNGRAHWRKQRFADYVRHHRMSWPTYANGTLDETDETLRDMARKYPQIEQLRELRYSLSKLRLNDLAVGHDHRNRAPLWAFGTKTARNAPGASQYVFVSSASVYAKPPTSLPITTRYRPGSACGPPPRPPRPARQPLDDLADRHLLVDQPPVQQPDHLGLGLVLFGLGSPNWSWRYERATGAGTGSTRTRTWLPFAPIPNSSRC